MESIFPKNLFSKLFFLTEVLKFYGYADENFVLISQLCQSSRKFLFEELATLIQNAMFSKRRDLKIDGFNFDEAEALVKTQKACLYNLTITVGTRNSYRAWMHLLENCKINSEITYRKIIVMFFPTEVHHYNKCVKYMKELGYDIRIIEFDMRCYNRLHVPSVPLEYIDRFNDSNMAEVVKECEFLQLINNKN